MDSIPELSSNLDMSSSGSGHRPEGSVVFGKDSRSLYLTIKAKRRNPARIFSIRFVVRDGLDHPWIGNNGIDRGT